VAACLGATWIGGGVAGTIELLAKSLHKGGIIDFAKEVRAQLTSEPKRYTSYSREYLGWGVFALMAR